MWLWHNAKWGIRSILNDKGNMSKWISAVSCLSKSSNFCGFILNPLSVSPFISGDAESTSRFREHMIFIEIKSVPSDISRRRSPHTVHRRSALLPGRSLTPYRKVTTAVYRLHETPNTGCLRALAVMLVMKDVCERPQRK